MSLMEISCFNALIVGSRSVDQKQHWLDHELNVLGMLCNIILYNM